MAVSDAAVADHRAMKRVRDDPDDGVLQGEINITTLITGDRLDLIPMLMFVKTPRIARAAVAPEMPRQFLPKPPPINRQGQPGIIPRRQAADRVEGNQIVYRLWQRHIAPLFGTPRIGFDIRTLPGRGFVSECQIPDCTRNLHVLVVL